MSDWVFLNKHRLKSGHFASKDTDHFNGAFNFYLNGLFIGVIASDGMGWQHVRVSLPDSRSCTPSWETMCKIKALFWEDEDAVIQIHPPKSEYVNNHPGCLHLWRPNDQGKLFLPPSILVGLKGIQLST